MAGVVLPTAAAKTSLLLLCRLMSLSPGSRLGPCGIVAPITTGWMREAYPARDTRLHRTVAVKVRPRILPKIPSSAKDLRVRHRRHQPSSVFPMGTDD